MAFLFLEARSFLEKQEARGKKPLVNTLAPLLVKVGPGVVDDYSEFDTVTWHNQPPLTPPFQGGELITIFLIQHCAAAQQLLRSKKLC
ncbi:MAG: hypothetical protein IJV38_01245 [Prevotella sp.]|nr:hypothetical protein [Prevotella sp.]